MRRTDSDDLYLDAHDFYNNNLFDNSSYGVGAWGDPANDYQISTGGLKDIMLAYPSPHRIRRNYTLFPFANPHFLNRFLGDPEAPLPPADLAINITMTKEKVDYLVNDYQGDFIGLQTDLESVSVYFTLSHPVWGVLSCLYREFMVAFISSSLGEYVLVSGRCPYGSGG